TVCRRARGFNEAAAATSPNDRGCRFYWARCEHNLRALLNKGGRRKEAEVSYRHAVTRLRGLSEEASGDAEYRHQLVASLNNLAFLLAKTERLPEAEAAIREGLAVSERLVHEFPNPPTYRASL